jgi:GNAT superfamily N-acetyltransferase
MEVRKATVADADAIARVHTATWRVAYRHVFGDERLQLFESDPKRWRTNLGPNTDRTTFVALRESEVIGFATVGPERDGGPEGELYALYVHPDEWDTGAGRVLMQRAEEQLLADGSREPMLWVLEDNPRARRFYERAGWSLDGATKRDSFLGLEVGEVRYRKVLTR